MYLNTLANPSHNFMESMHLVYGSIRPLNMPGEPVYMSSLVNYVPTERDSS